jgi:hypothetical protein
MPFQMLAGFWEGSSTDFATAESPPVAGSNWVLK